MHWAYVQSRTKAVEPLRLRLIGVGEGIAKKVFFIFLRRGRDNVLYYMAELIRAFWLRHSWSGFRHTDRFRSLAVRKPANSKQAWPECLIINYLLTYNLGQYKMEKLSPIPPKAMMKARAPKSKSAPFWHHWNGGGVVQMFHLFCPRLRCSLLESYWGLLFNKL